MGGVGPGLTRSVKVFATPAAVAADLRGRRRQQITTILIFLPSPQPDHRPLPRDFSSFSLSRLHLFIHILLHHSIDPLTTAAFRVSYVPSSSLPKPSDRRIPGNSISGIFAKTGKLMEILEFFYTYVLIFTQT